MKDLLKLSLQFFGEGAGASGGDGASDGAATGENATAAAEQRLRELGVPEAKARKNASKVASKMPSQPVAAEAPDEDTNVESATTKDTPTTEDAKSEGVSTNRMSWDDIMADPEYNKQMQSVIKSRLRSAKDAEENLSKITPALELLARKHGLDIANIDYDALAKAINDDNSYYEEKALEMGVPVEMAKKFDVQERDIAREKAQAERTLQEKAYEEHFSKLETQGEDLKKVFPSFDLRKELQNPIFARMTAPGKGIMSVEDAYRAVHRKEIEAAQSQVIAQKTAQQISNSIQAGYRRPDESGASSQAPSVSTFNYKTASKEQRLALKQRIRSAASRGEKLYPGQ
jgi:hypothetical protein